jgi:hypothetical protein
MEMGAEGQLLRNVSRNCEGDWSLWRLYQSVGWNWSRRLHCRCRRAHLESEPLELDAFHRQVGRSWFVREV